MLVSHSGRRERAGSGSSRPFRCVASPPGGVFLPLLRPFPTSSMEKNNPSSMKGGGDDHIKENNNVKMTRSKSPVPGSGWHEVFVPGRVSELEGD